jgi:two-component system cell cycle sensor histidine kinase/response regulator CckA
MSEVAILATPLQVLILEDRQTDVELVLYELRRGGFDPTWTRVDTEEDFLAQLRPSLDIILSDYSLPAFDAMRALEITRNSGFEIPFIIVSGSIGEEVAVEAMKKGATDYLLKDRLGRLGSAVHNAIEQIQLRETAKRSEAARHSAETLFRQLVENSLAGIQILQDGKYVFTNSRVAEMFGYTEEELRGIDSWSLAVAPEDRPMVVEQVRRRLSGELPRAQYTFKGQRKDGSLIDVEIHSNRIELDGRPAVLGMLVDITQRKRAEAEMQHTTDLLQAIAEWTPDAVFIKDRSGRYLLFNPAAAHFVGRPVEEVLGRDDTQLFSPESSLVVMQRDQEVMASGIMETREEELTAAGVKRVFLATKAPYRDNQGNIVGLIGISRDITERKRAEAERDHLLTRLQLQMDRMPLGCLLTDASFRIVDWNTAAERIFGYTKAEMIGIGPPFEKIVDPGDWPQEQDILRRIRSGDMAAHSVNSNVTKEGRKIVCEWNNTPVLDSEGNFVGVLAVAQDITSRREAEATILLRDRAIQAVTQGIIITDPALQDNPIIYVSPSFEKLTGYSASDALGKNCRFLQGPDTDSESVARLRRAIRDAQPCKLELLNYRKDGTSFWNELSISPVFDPRGRVTHFVGSQADVTSRRKMEEQLRQVQKMEAVGRLAGGIAHDFNNLLTIINGYSELILDTLTIEASFREYVDQIKAAGERAAALTGQLLAFSRKQMLQPVIVDLNVQIRDMQKLLRRLIGEDIELLLDLHSDLSRIYADRSQIEQVVLNLILNSRDAMPMGGTLIVETRDVDFDSEYVSFHPEARPGRNVMLAVCDTGCGMDKETIVRIFEPFFTTKEADKGTGLGLPTVYGIVKQSNGHIDVYSEVGLGTTFKVYLPAYSSAGEAVPNAEPIPQELLRGTETVLLVEDEDSVRALAAKILRSNGYVVLEASNGKQAIEQLENELDQIKLVITDVVMPVMGGRQLVEHLHKQRPEIKILFMSGYTEDSVVRHGILSSAADFLQKPFTALSLTKKVRDSLDAQQ